MHPLVQAHLAALRRRAPRLRDARLGRLAARVPEDGSAVLRLSPRRLVWRAEDPGDGTAWACKLDRPGRWPDPLRARLGLTALHRERRAWRALARALPEAPVAVLLEELGGGAMLLARPWIEGEACTGALPARAAAIGAGLAELHALGWRDDDLLPGDLLWTPQGRLLPADLGAARVARRPPPPRRRRRDLERFLAGLSEEGARAAAPALLDAYADRAGRAPGDPERLLAAAAALRRRARRRRSRRCLRSNADFARAAGGSVRRRAAPTAGPVRCWLLPRRRARRLFRRLYERELRGASGPRPCALERRGPRSLVVARLEGPAQAHLGDELGDQREDDAHDQAEQRREGDHAP